MNCIHNVLLRVYRAYLAPHLRSTWLQATIRGGLVVFAAQLRWPVRRGCCHEHLVLKLSCQQGVCD